LRRRQSRRRQEVPDVKYRRMPIEVESPEQLGYDRIRNNLTESSVRDRSLADLGIEIGDMLLFYGDHAGHEGFREDIAAQCGGAGRDDVLVTAGAAQALFIIATSPTMPPTSRRRGPSAPTSASSSCASRTAFAWTWRRSWRSSSPARST
jgi:DNA-binding transcriptional MocR family regulator